MHDITDADARGSEGIYKNGELIGRATSGGFGFRVNKSLALGMVLSNYAIEGAELEIEILGQRHRATVIPESAFDAENLALRS